MNLANALRNLHAFSSVCQHEACCSVEATSDVVEKRSRQCGSASCSTSPAMARRRLLAGSKLQTVKLHVLHAVILTAPLHCFLNWRSMLQKPSKNRVDQERPSPLKLADAEKLDPGPDPSLAARMLHLPRAVHAVLVVFRTLVLCPLPGSCLPEVGQAMLGDRKAKSRGGF